MTTAIGWLIVQRELTGSVLVADTPEIWATTVFTTPERRIVGMRLAATGPDSLVEAVTMAAEAPAQGAPSEHPTIVLTAPSLVEPVRVLLGRLGIAAGVDEVVTPDWAEDALTEMTGHLAGRRQVVDAPTPAERALLHEHAAAYARAAPWERRADDLHLRLALSIGAERSDVVAVILGNAGISRGLALFPGRDLPAAGLRDDEDVLPPAGTCHLAFVDRDAVPPEVREQTARYGWPDDLDAPLFVAIGPEGPQEIDADRARALTVALAATVEHDRQGAALGMRVTGDVTLADGRRARYRATMEPTVPEATRPELRIFSGEVRDDLLPDTTVVGLGGLPWEELAGVRRSAARHRPLPWDRPTSGEGLPILILGMDSADGDRVARALHAASPEGVALFDDEEGVFIVILTSSGLYGVTRLPADAVAIDGFQRRLAATEGWHGILVSTISGQRGDPIFGFFECVLASPLVARRTAASAPPHPPRRPGQPRRRGR